MRSLNQIEQELTALEQTVASIAEEFHDAYGQYLDALGQAVRQQLILACYHLCTHSYPEAFLKLTFSQRQELQQTLRQVAKQAQSETVNMLQPILARDLSGQAEEEELDEADQSDDESEEDEDLDLEEAIDQVGGEDDFFSNASDLDLPTALRFLRAAMQPDPVKPDDDQQSSSQDEASARSDSEATAKPDNEPDNELKNELGSELNNELENEPDNELDDPQSDEPPIEDRPLTPKDLLYWQHRLEESVGETLYEVSHATNRLLYRSDLLPRQLPEPILEVATKAGLGIEAAASPPNLLSLMIETRSEESKRPTMITITAVRLRLSEIEFASGSLSVWRSKIRELSARLSKIGRDYYQKEKERSVAQAEAAWRSSWFED